MTHILSEQVLCGVFELSFSGLGVCCGECDAFVYGVGIPPLRPFLEVLSTADGAADVLVNNLFHCENHGVDDDAVFVVYDVHGVFSSQSQQPPSMSFMVSRLHLGQRWNLFTKSRN